MKDCQCPHSVSFRHRQMVWQQHSHLERVTMNDHGSLARIHAHFTDLSSTELTDHERCLLCSAINARLWEGIGTMSETTANELRSLGTRLSCSREWRAVFAASATAVFLSEGLPSPWKMDALHHRDQRAVDGDLLTR